MVIYGILFGGMPSEIVCYDAYLLVSWYTQHIFHLHQKCFMMGGKKVFTEIYNEMYSKKNKN